MIWVEKDLGRYSIGTRELALESVPKYLWQDQGYRYPEDKKRKRHSLEPVISPVDGRSPVYNQGR